ncbi:MAG: hypothetical protein FJY95_15155 [Candidatus Handelsmanbacteria bacterium]|nr:hypothetical protein [Candidatus Handelsmanbacteria bacterium]
MEKDDQRQIAERLEAIEALSTLFKNLWYEKIKDEVASEKVRAYLTVYEDAVPHLNQVLAFAHQSAFLLAGGRLDQDKYERLQLAFAQMGAGLLGRDLDAGLEIPGIDDLESSVDLSPQQEADMEEELLQPELGASSQHLGMEPDDEDRADAVLAEPHNGAANIDSLFDNSEHQGAASSQEEIDALLGGDLPEEDGDELEDLLDEGAVEEAGETEPEPDGELELAAPEEAVSADGDLDDLLGSVVGEEEEEAAPEDELALAEDEQAVEAEEELELDLSDLELEEQPAVAVEDAEPEAAAVEEVEEEEMDLDDLAVGKESAEEGELDLGDLLEAGDQQEAEVSDEDLSALLNGEEEEEAELPKPAPKAAPKVPAKPAPKPAFKAEVAPKPAALTPKAAPTAEPKAPAKAGPKAAPAKDKKGEEDSISRDEIDALFG